MPQERRKSCHRRPRRGQLPAIEYVMVSLDGIPTNHSIPADEQRLLDMLKHHTSSAPLHFNAPISKEAASLQHACHGLNSVEESVPFDVAQWSDTLDTVATPPGISFLSDVPNASRSPTVAQSGLLPASSPMPENAVWSPGLMQAQFQPEAPTATGYRNVPKNSIFRAIRNGNENIVRFLIKNGADLSNKDDRGRTVIHYAVACQKLSVTKIILEHLKDKSLLDSRDLNGYTALHTAIQTRDVDTVTALLDLGANVYIANNDGEVALDLAIDTGSVSLVERVLASRA
ncbi:putative ankyrin repeat protein [Beauveria bassiana]|nr:putative ankyrin repeat protein [Beauveria bassiana]